MPVPGGSASRAGERSGWAVYYLLDASVFKLAVPGVSRAGFAPPDCPDCSIFWCNAPFWNASPGSGTPLSACFVPGFRRCSGGNPEQSTGHRPQNRHIGHPARPGPGLRSAAPPHTTRKSADTAKSAYLPTTPYGDEWPMDHVGERGVWAIHHVAAGLPRSRTGRKYSLKPSQLGHRFGPSESR
jgi:hypothetical protein